jgi:hypothetical protein
MFFAGASSLYDPADETYGCETVDMGPNSPRNILTWDGWHTFLEVDMKLDPDEFFKFLTGVTTRLGISLTHPLTRQDLPAAPDPSMQELYNIIKTKLSQQSDQDLMRAQQQALRDEERFTMASNVEAMRARHARLAIARII